MYEYSEKQLLRDIRSTGNDSPLDGSGRTTAVPSSSSSMGTGSFELVSTIGLYNQARVKGGGRRPRDGNLESVSPHMECRGDLKPCFQKTIKGGTRDWREGRTEEARLPYHLSIGPPSLPDH